MEPSEHRPLLRRAVIQNFKSLAEVEVSLGPLTLLVGRNGSGKSNFLDALRFVADALQTSLAHAVNSRGGIREILHRNPVPSKSFSILIALDLADGQRASYTLEVEDRESGGFGIRRESLTIGADYFQVEVAEGEASVSASIPRMPPAYFDRLYLVTASGFAAFRPVHDFLMGMGIYNLNPQAMRDLQAPSPGEILQANGANIASVVAKLKTDRPAILERAHSYLSLIVPEVTKVERIALGPRETLQFWQVGASPSSFLAASMSDGTLHALGTLIAVSQPAGTSLVGIEEPENALHPAVAGVLMDALHEAATRTQILVTTHSPDLLDQVELEEDCLLAVTWRKGRTLIAPLDEASLTAIRDHLYTPGELLRLDQLDPAHRDDQVDGSGPVQS